MPTVVGRATLAEELPPRLSKRTAQQSGSFDNFDALLDALKAGHPLAFRQVFEDYGPRVRAFGASRRVDDPDGLANEVMLAVFHGASSFRGTEGKFTSFVFRIARNKIIDDARKQSRRPVGVELEETHAESVISTDNEIEATLSSDRVVALLDHLTAVQRDVVIMRVLLGMSHQEIGDAIGKRTGASRAIYHRALASLKESLESGISAERGRSQYPNWRGKPDL